MHSTPPLRGILWDFDGTLVDTRRRNYQVNRRIVAELSQRDPDEIPALRSLQAYEEANHRTTNWRELYTLELGLPMERVDSAAALWNAFQVTETTRAPSFDGVPEVLTALAHLPHGIVSLNGRANIERILQTEGLHSHFAIILGHEEVAEQKPAPDGLLHCIEHLGQDQPGRFLYIGDHETDSRCAANANQVLRQAGQEVEIIMVGVLYGEGGRAEPWRTQPDFEARSTEEILDLVRQLS